MFDICMKFLNILQQIYPKPINENKILRQMSKTTFCSREKTEQSVDVTRTHWKKESGKYFWAKQVFKRWYIRIMWQEKCYGGIVFLGITHRFCNNLGWPWDSQNTTPPKGKSKHLTFQSQVTKNKNKL